MVMPSSVLHADRKRINSAGDDDKAYKHAFLVHRRLVEIIICMGLRVFISYNDNLFYRNLIKT